MTRPRAWKVGVVPAAILIGVNALPLAGLDFRVRILDLPLQVWLSLAAAVFFAALLPVYWRQGFREASRSVGEDAQVATSESARKLQEARYQEQKRSRELDTALNKLKDRDAEILDLSGSARRNLAIAGSLVEASGEAVVVTDIHGVIQYLSIPASNMCGVHRADAVGNPFDHIFRLFDPSAENPEMHPVRRIAINAVDATDPAPKLEGCMLTNRSGKTKLVLVTSMVINDREGTAMGAHIKLEAQDENGSPIGETRVPTPVDPVTGLKTKDAFMRRTEEMLRQARTQAAVHHLLFIGPDNLDFVADRYGYRAAEQMEWKIAEVCREQAGTDGEAFAIAAMRIGVLLPNVESDDALAVAERIRQTLQQSTLTWQGESIDLPATITALQMDAASPGVGPLLDLAEQMLRSGRRAGGNKVHTGMPANTRDDGRFNDQGWVDWLQQRLQAGLGHLLSQEIAPVGKRDKPMIECYVRVEDTDGVWISPREYLPALRRVEKTAFMDLWVLDQILGEMREKAELIDKYLAVSLNLAAETILDRDFVGRASERIAGSGVHARHICFEILENTATMLPREVSRFISLIQTSGAKVAIDQSRGTGLQQLLRDCRPDFIKIDPALVRDYASDELAKAQLQWLLTSAKIMKVSTVACGIEDEHSIELLKKAGVNYLQGSAINKIGPLML